MNHDRFIHILEAYGADSTRWPEDERAEAITFADANPDTLADALAIEAELDILLGQADRPPSELLTQRILNGLPVTRKLMPDWYAPVSATAAALIIGIALGFTNGVVSNQNYDDIDLYAEAFSGLEEDDWVTWVEAET